MVFYLSALSRCDVYVCLCISNRSIKPRNQTRNGSRGFLSYFRVLHLIIPHIVQSSNAQNSTVQTTNNSFSKVPHMEERRAPIMANKGRNGEANNQCSGSGSVIICTDPDLDLDPSINKQNKVRTTLISNIFLLFIFEENVPVLYLQKVISKKT
jgi:hypothetical protein